MPPNFISVCSGLSRGPQAGEGGVRRREATSPESGQNLLGSGRLHTAAAGKSLELNSPLWGQGAQPGASLSPRAVLQLLCTRTASLAPVTGRHPSGVGIHHKWSML